MTQQWEEWRDIPGYEGLYQVSNIGNVKRLKSGEIAKQQPNEKGYLRISLYRDRKYQLARIHRLVLLTFIGAPSAGMVVNHKNGVKSDNRLENLEYITQKENVRHSIEILGKGQLGEGHHNHKLTESDVQEIRHLLKCGLLHREISERFDVVPSTIGWIARGVTWKGK